MENAYDKYIKKGYDNLVHIEIKIYEYGIFIIF